MANTVVLLGGGIDSLGIVRRALEMGLHVVVVDADPEAPARKVPSVKFLQASCYEAAAVERALDGQHYGAVLCAGTDAPHVMAHFGGVPERTAAISRDKWLQAQTLRDFVKVPETRRLDWDGVVRVPGGAKAIKPSNSRGGRGVIRVPAGEPLTKELWDIASAQVQEGGVVLAQDWIGGVQLSSESLVQGGKILWTTYAERNYSRLNEFAPYVIEDGGDMPPLILDYSFENDWETKADAALQRCVQAIGLIDGVLKGDLVWDGCDIWVIEVAARLSGGRMCSDLTPKVWGVDFVGMAIRIALGDYVWPGEISPFLRMHACSRFLFPKSPTNHPERGPMVIGYGPDTEAARRYAGMRLEQLSYLPQV